jgi:hypothetical protein
MGFFMLNTLCNLLVQLLLSLARGVTLGLKSRKTHDHILQSHLRLPQPGGPDPRIHIPQEQGGPVILPDTGFLFRLLLRQANCNPEAEVTLRLTVSQSVSTSWYRAHCRTWDQISILSLVSLTVLFFFRCFRSHLASLNLHSTLPLYWP